MLLCDERLDDADGILHLIFREQGGFGEAQSCLVHVLDGDTCGIDVRNVVATLYVSALF